MEYKNFFDCFKRYRPNNDIYTALSRAYRVVPRYQKDPFCVEVDLYFSEHIDALELYLAEDECRALYEAQVFKILPHFPPESFRIEYFEEIATEASLCGAVTKGFFAEAHYEDTGDKIICYLPFSMQGIDFVQRSNTLQILQNILLSRYGLNKEILLAMDVEGQSVGEERRARRYEERMRRAEEENIEKNRRQIEEMRREIEAREREADPHYDFARKSGILKEAGGATTIDATTFHMGVTTYDTSASELLFGEDFDILSPSSIADANKVQRLIVLGTVFFTETKENRKRDRYTCTIGISDGATGIYLKRVFPPEEIGFMKGIKSGMHIAVFGSSKQDKFTNETFIQFYAIKKIKKLERMDNAPRKRVELHLHSRMSQMDALITPEEIVKTAQRWGHPAIAITDHGNVQCYPEIMLALEKSGDKNLKILYGMEAYFVNDTARCVFGTKYPAFDDEMVVFDIETTGLSAHDCKIIEIGAVKIRGGEIIDEMDIFVDPEMPIPEEITNLTSITDEMVAGAPKEEEALRIFFDFVGDCMLIAHNATFDCGFIRVASERHNIPFTNTFLDTVGLSRYVNPELKKHKLDIIAKHYKLEEFHHHRASDDARTLAYIFFKMQERLHEEGIQNFEQMIGAMSEKTDPLKLKPYHMIIFARNLVGLKNLYKLISRSYLDYYKRYPRIPKTILDDYREGLIIGSACESGELFRAILEGRSEQEIEEIAEFYDYLEIQPICNNAFLIAEGKVANEDGLRDLNRRIYELGKKLGKPVCATCDAHFLEREDEIYRKILLAGQKYPDADRDIGIYLRTTEEMLEEFRYLGDDVAEEVVIDNPNKIAQMCEKIRPIPEGRYEPSLEGAVEDLQNSCWKRAKEWYGDPLPELVETRLKRELDSIIGNGFAVLYMIAVKLVAYSESLGYQVGSRGSVGSSFVATMSGISEVNPLPPHYRCPKCRHTEFFTDGSVGSGFDLEDKACPDCGTMMIVDGHDIPFETFLGFKGDKSPDIDLNFSGDVQGKVHKYTEELFGKGQVFRAGTTGTLADKTAFGYINKYLEERQIRIPSAEIGHMVTRMVGIKRTTGQHPGGIIVVPREYEIYDFTPVQHPADDPDSDIITTHFQFTYLHDTILKLDELGHDIPTKYRMLEKYTNTSVLDVKMNDRSAYELFWSTKPLGITPQQIGGVELGTFGIPEMGTKFIQGVLKEAQPRTFSDLLQISGLTHGTDVWLGNARDLILAGICTISEVVGTRDGIMLYLIQKGLDNSTSFKIMEDVRKGKGLKPEYEEEMLAHGVPDWYIGSCKKIKYMFPKAHAAAYDMSAIRLCWYKIYYPMEFYAAFLSVAPGGFDAEIVGRGYEGVSEKIKELEEMDPNDATQKDKELLATLQLVREAMARGIKFLGVSLRHSDSKYFLPENGKIRMPFNSLSGVGDTAAEKIVEVRDAGEIYSIQQLRERTGISKTVIEILRRNHVLDELTETDQFTFF